MNSQAEWTQGDGLNSLTNNCLSLSGIGETVSVDTVTRWGNCVCVFWKSSRLYLIRLLPTQIAGSFPFNGLGPRQDSGCVPLVSKQPSFVCQLSTLTGPESQGRLGTMSSTSPLAIFSHWPRFSLQIQTTSIRCTVEKISFTSAEAWLWVWNKRIQNHTSTQDFQIMQKLQNCKTHTQKKEEVDLQNKTVATTVARQHNQFLLSWRWSLLHVLWLTQECKKTKTKQNLPFAAILFN